MKKIWCVVMVIFLCAGFSVVSAEEIVKSTKKITTVSTDETIETIEPEDTTFWERAGENTWSGIKTGAQYTGKGIKKCGIWIKDGTLYLGEKVGLHTSETELEANERIIQEANKTLTQSKARRQMRTADQTETAQKK